ncbi:LysM peptidoglycan-binding domain-containing protein [Winogradskyella wichelsiae]|uniref:LysM peptidoglycan-binding domain-containing protein n=1 Tax=Winogradskyella wichelsiae TaxID=2697007 RepID=UPI0015CC13CD|nr:LysM peptidoglycan-binding domain-containing protein [Winogradskyella wichelsiae]
MQKSFRLIIISLIGLLVSMQATGQDESSFQDVILDGKPALLDVNTGEIILVKFENIALGAQIDSVHTPYVPTNNLESYDVIDADAIEYHTVKEGETLLDLSEKYEVSLNQLMHANNLKTTLIDVGQKLWVKNLDSEGYPLIATKQKAESVKENKTDSNLHVVKSGNTLYGISRQFHLSIPELKSLNNLQSNLIQVGQKLKVKSNDNKNQGSNKTVYTVKEGDNLYRIALRNGTTIKSIKLLNRLTNDVIIIGQKLKLN